jgi:hypothetical protein
MLRRKTKQCFSIDFEPHILLSEGSVCHLERLGMCACSSHFIFNRNLYLITTRNPGMAPENTDNINPDCDIVDQCNACQTDRFYSQFS